MGNTIDIIKGLIIRIGMNAHKNKNKKLVTQLYTQLSGKLYEILTETDDEVFFDNFKKLIASQAANPYVTKNFYPKDINAYAGYRNRIGFSNDFRFEIRWIISCILVEKDAINDFVIQREKYDTCILLNQYEEAMKIVKEVESSYGCSFWTMECRFFLNSKLGRDNNELIENIPSNVLGAIMCFYEIKNRESITSDEYYYIVKKELTNARKRVNGGNDAIALFDYCISGDTYQGKTEKILLTFSAMHKCSIIDRYLFVLRICNELMNRSKSNYLYVCMQAYITLLDDIKDDHLTALRFIFDKEEERKSSYMLKSRLDSAKSSFISGKLLQARQEAIELLNVFPNNTEAMSLLVETNILIGDGKKQFENTNLGMLLDRLSAVYTLRGNRDDAMEDVSKLALACSQSTWAQSILSNVWCRWAENNSFEYTHHKILSNLQHLSIETMLVSLEKEESLRFVQEKLDQNDRYVRFRKALLERDYASASQICNIEQIRDYLFVCGLGSISEKMKRLHPIEGTGASISMLTMKEFLSTINMNNDSHIVFEIVTNLVIDNIYTSLFVPWEKIIDYIDNGPSEIRKNICTPILYYVYAYYIEKSKKDDLGIVCNDFFEFEGIERPSAMDISEEKYHRKLLIYFLKNVCTPKIMDDAVYVFSNTQERDLERVEICNLLTGIDSANAREYEQEIREITQKLMINRELKSIDESRIHVNVEGIRDKLLNAEGTGDRFDKSLKNDFQRYLFYQYESLEQLLLFMRGGEELERIRPLYDTAERLLSELILKIRDAFVSSDEYGLNGYLSLNIRHGTLEDELRSPLHKSMLYVKKDTAGNTYIIHKHWTRYLSDEDHKILQNAFGIFYQTTEAILARLKNEYIQIRTEAKNEKGVFDYRLYETNIEEISYYINKDTTFEEFFNIVVNYFWLITERNLENIKNVILTEIMRDYMDAFADLKNAVAKIGNKSLLRELQQKISEAEIDMQNVLKRICYWFQRSNESRHNDFDLQFAFDLGLRTIENMHPEKHFVADELEPTVSDKIPGSYLKSFDGIFYNLFDNIYKKAMPSGPNDTIRIGYSLKNTDGKIRIYIENDYDCTKDISEDIARIEEAKELYKSGRYIEKVKGEGGTGIPKICKIITYDLKRYPYIDFGYKKDKNIFFMEIKI